MNDPQRGISADQKNQKEYKTVGDPFSDNPRMICRDVNVYYGDKQAIFDVSLDIVNNEVIALIGPSGCGKSTFLRCLNRMNDFDSNMRVEGRILFDGHDVSRLRNVYALRSRIGVDPPLFPAPRTDYAP